MDADPVKMARTLRVGGGEIDVSSPLIVGIVNATPDSFSDSGERTPAAWIRNALACYEAGAAIVEVGGESNVSNRPPVTAAVEIERVEPVIGALVAAGAVVTIDTHRVETARAAIAAGAAIVNDISGLRDPAMIEVCAEGGAGVVLMHTETPPKTPSGTRASTPRGSASGSRPSSRTASRRWPRRASPGTASSSIPDRISPRRRARRWKRCAISAAWGASAVR